MVIGDSFYRQRWKALETLFAARKKTGRGEGPVRVGVSWCFGAVSGGFTRLQGFTINK
jgi:hypothetical protein